jgi:hypothetical protein
MSMADLRNEITLMILSTSGKHPSEQEVDDYILGVEQWRWDNNRPDGTFVEFVQAVCDHMNLHGITGEELDTLTPEEIDRRHNIPAGMKAPYKN